MCGLKASTIDGELCMKYIAVAGRPKLVAIMTKHVDDLKMAGAREEIVFILQQLEKVFLGSPTLNGTTSRTVERDTFKTK